MIDATLFWSKVNKGVRFNDCWEWTASKNRKGYGQFGIQHRCRLAHRVAYALTHGDPGDKCVLHRCDNPACVNPSHLFLGTKADNNADMRAKGRYARGETNGQSKLTRDQAFQIRWAGGKQHEIAARYGVTQSTVSRIKADKVWIEVGPSEEANV